MSIGDFFINVLSGGIIGGIASYIASKQFQKKNSENNKPDLKLSNKLIETKRTTGKFEPAIQLKLLNHTDQDLSNIRIELEGIEDLATDDSPPYLRIIAIANRDLLSVKKFDKNDNYYLHHVHTVNIFNDTNVILDIKKYDFVRISIHATCPYYNTSIIISNDYKVNTCLLDNTYIFNAGNVMTTRKIK